MFQNGKSNRFLRERTGNRFHSQWQLQRANPLQPGRGQSEINLLVKRMAGITARVIARQHLFIIFARIKRSRIGQDKTRLLVQFSPLLRFQLRAEFINFQRYRFDAGLKRNFTLSLFLSFSVEQKTKKKQKKEEERRERKRDMESKKRRSEALSVIERKFCRGNRRPGLFSLSLSLCPPFFSSRCLSLSLSLSLFSYQFASRLCVPTSRNSAVSLHQRGIAHPRKYGVRKSFKLPHERSFCVLV